MAPRPFFDPTMVGIEGFYSLVVLVLCLLVFFKTKEMYDLTKHRGIQFFRYAFLFFGLAYAFRLMLYLGMISANIVCEYCRIGRQLLPVSHMIVAYFSTMAILYLVYSTIWRKIAIEQYLTFSNIVAVIVAASAMIYRSPYIVSAIQFLLLIFAAIVIFTAHKKEHKKFNTRTLYILIFIFWLISLLIVDPRRLLPLPVKIVFQLISIMIFVAIYYKVAKWVK